MIKLITLNNDPRTIYDCSHFIHEVFEYPHEQERPCCRECNDYSHDKHCRSECDQDARCHEDSWNDWNNEHGEWVDHHSDDWDVQSIALGLEY